VSLSTLERERYARHLALPEIDVAGQENLRAARVLVIGVGGLGSPAALYLAAAGTGTIGVLDCDRVELSNLQRQVLFDTAGLARPKVEAARERLLALNPGIEVIPHALELRAANAAEIFAGYDVVLDGTDRLGTRYLVNDACVLLGKPLVSAAIHRFEGQAMTYVPGQGPCYRCLFPTPAEGLVPSCAQAGVLGVLPGVLGAIQATEAIKLITGAGEPLIGRLLTFDALEMRFQELRFERRGDCAVCGERPTITTLSDTAAQCADDAVSEIPRLSPEELRQWIEVGVGGGRELLLVDVRETYEFTSGHLPGARNIPVGELQGRLDEIPRGVTPVFICRSGARSLAACSIALKGGIAKPANLEGGMLAWRSDSEPPAASR
jgi:sulfur-carrier protein adenylyltransferase/sulfurtransferase